jgi:hypothetical protein
MTKPHMYSYEYHDIEKTFMTRNHHPHNAILFLAKLKTSLSGKLMGAFRASTMGS